MTNPNNYQFGAKKHYKKLTTQPPLLQISKFQTPEVAAVTKIRLNDKC
jgi:hypothetical protein